jgi:PAS domain S-box-containing protein
MDQTIRILILDDSARLVAAAESRLRSTGDTFDFRIAASSAELRSCLNDFRPHLVLSEYTLRQLSCLEALRILREAPSPPPLIVVTETMNGEHAAAVMKAGATDYVSRGNLDRLAPAVRSALEKRNEQERREKAETTLRERDEMIRLITDNVSDLVALIDVNGRRLYNSPSYEPILGDPVSLRGTDSFSEIHPDDRERIRTTFLDTVATGKGQRTEYRLLARDGSVRHIESVGTVIKGTSGAPAAVLVVARDITDRRKAEEALRYSEARFRRLFEHSSDAVALVSGEGFIVYESPSVTRVLGYAPEELIGRNMFDLIHPDDLAQARKAFADLIGEDNARSEIILRYRHKNGTWSWIEEFCNNLINDSVINAVVVNYRDIGERRLAELATDRSLSLMKATLQATADGILVVGMDGAIVTYNEQFCRMWGIPAEVLEERDDAKALRFVMDQLQSPDEFIRKVRSLYNEPDAESFDFLHFRDGRVFERFSKPQFLKGAIAGRVWSFRDVTDRYKADEALRRTTDQYEGLVNTIDGIVWEAQPAPFRFTFVSETVRRLLGYAPEDWFDISFWHNCVHPDDREWVRTFMTESSRQPRDHEFEFRMISLDGHVVWLRDIVSVISRNDAIIALRGVMIDITERKRTEQMNDAVYRIAQAADHAATVDEMFQTVHAIISEVMPARNFYIALYDEKKDLLSFPYFVDEVDSRPEPIKPGKGLTEYVLRTGRSLLCDPEIDRKLQESGETELIGVYSPVWLGVPLILEGKTIGAMVVQHYSDPTAYGKPEQQILEFVSSQVARTIHRKRTEKHLRENEERYRVIAEQTGQLVYDFDIASGRITWTGAITGITGYDDEEFQGVDITGWEEHIHPDDRATAVRMLDESMEKGTKYDVEYRFRRKDGRYVHIQDHGVFLNDGHRKPFRMLGTMNDISQRKILEEQLVQSQKMEAVGQLASGIAHDFNNVMGVVLTAGHLIKTVSQNPDITRYTNMIENATLRGSAIAKQLLQFSRAEVSKLAPISISHVVTEVKKILDHSFPKTIRTHIVINVDQGVIMADESQIHQILLNLCINARDAMPLTKDGEPEGSLTISVESAPSDSLPPGALADADQDYVALRVSDTGSGITEEVRRRMFDPFFTTKEIGKGTGLGLSIVHGIVKNHHGFIDVHSVVGEGTRFSLFFPTVKQEPVTELEQVQQIKDPEGGTILVIEDETALRDLLKDILLRSGYSVLEAADGEQGVEVYRIHQDHIDLVISDIGLPKLSGEGVFRELKKLNQEVQLIFSTGFLDTERRADLLRSGAREVIHKPYKVHEILRSIRSTFAESRSGE